MCRLLQRKWITQVAALLVTALCFGAVLSLSKPAEARVWVGFTVGAPAWGYYGPVYHRYYYPYYRPYYPARYWRWRHRHWCYWHPYRCGWYW